MQRTTAPGPSKVDTHTPMHIEGTGTPVILLHGCPTTPRSLDPLRLALARAAHRVVVPDLVGVGVGFTEALERLVAALQAAGIHRAAVVGHSSGSYRALQLALDGRIEVTRLVGLGPVAYLSPSQLEQFAAVADAVNAGALDLPELMWQTGFGATFRAARPDAKAEIDAWFEALGPAAADDLRSACDGPDLRPHLSGLDLPVYLRVGALDTSTPPAEAEAMAASIPGARIDVVPDCAHFLQFEDAEATLDAVARFLRP